MAPHKTRALLLHMLPYRESSSILRLYSEDLGMVHAIARGVRGGTRDGVPLERGMILEATVYLKAHRTLHTLASPAVAEFFPGLRADLRRTAVRDAAFELVLRAVHPEDPHPELYRFLRDFVAGLEQASGPAVAPCALWRFLVQFAQHLGVGLDLARCVRCGRTLEAAEDTVLSVEDGGVACGRCVTTGRSPGLLPAMVRAFLAGPGNTPPFDQDQSSLRRITRLLSAWCRHHLDLSGDYPALDFVCELTADPPGARH